VSSRVASKRALKHRQRWRTSTALASPAPCHVLVRHHEGLAIGQKLSKALGLYSLNHSVRQKRRKGYRFVIDWHLLLFPASVAAVSKQRAHKRVCALSEATCYATLNAVSAAKNKPASRRRWRKRKTRTRPPEQQRSVRCKSARHDARRLIKSWARRRQRLRAAAATRTHLQPR
jgi:hypothetical protein